MFAEAFHSMIKGIHLALEVKTSFSSSTPVMGLVRNLAHRSLDIPLTAINGFTRRREEEEPVHKNLQSKT
jgi:hypothetical protein